MINGEKSLTKAVSLKRPDLPTVCEWIVKSWDKVENTMVIKSFLKCAISNDMAGSQDDELYSEFVRSDSTASSSSNRDDSDLIHDDDVSIYDDALSEEQFYQMFGHSD